MKAVKPIKPMKPLKPARNAHTANTKYGMGDNYGTGIKQKMGRIRSSGTGANFLPPKSLKKPPKSLA
jgi:hypothetical protein